MSQGVGVKGGETYLLAEALDQLPGVSASEASAGGGDQWRAVGAPSSSLVFLLFVEAVIRAVGNGVAVVCRKLAR